MNLFNINLAVCWISGVSIILLLSLQYILQRHVLTTSHRLLKQPITTTTTKHDTYITWKDDKHALLIMYDRVMLHRYGTKVNKTNVLSNKQCINLIKLMKESI